MFRIIIASDIHYSCKTEQGRQGLSFQGVNNRLVWLLLKFYRDVIWLKNPCFQNHLLDQFLQTPVEPDYVVVNGDFSTDTAFVGMSDDVTLESALECTGKIKKRFGEEKFLPTMGDHELGKLSMVSKLGGMRIQSYYRAQNELAIKPFWTCELGDYTLVGVTSSLLALPVYRHDILPGEKEEWELRRHEHLEKIRNFFDTLAPNKSVFLFCHDPTALPFLWKESGIQNKIGQVEQTIIGHLHSPLFYWKSRLLSGMPKINFLGPTARRMSTALNNGRYWKPFKVRLCPALAGIELLKDGGYFVLNLDPEMRKKPDFEFHKIHRR